MSALSRRTFVVAGSVALTGFAATGHAVQTDQKDTLTAGALVERIRAHVGIPWRAQTVDQIVAGDASTPVHGIATTMMATLDVLERAQAAGQNMVVTHETPFYLHQDHTDDIRDDAVLKYKLAMIQQHGMAIFHFHDHWHARQPDGIAVGMMQQLGWDKQVSVDNPKQFTFTGEPLAHFCRDIQKKLDARTMRVVGDPDLPVRRVLVSWGYVGREQGIAMLARPDVDVLIVGETREWEVVEYAQDAITAGHKKALIVVGHVLSEQGGMIECAAWLRTFVSEVPIAFVPAREPFWAPDHPVRI